MAIYSCMTHKIAHCIIQTHASRFLFLSNLNSPIFFFLVLSVEGVFFSFHFYFLTRVLSLVLSIFYYALNTCISFVAFFCVCVSGKTVGYVKSLFFCCGLTPTAISAILIRALSLLLLLLVCVLYIYKNVHCQ